MYSLGLLALPAVAAATLVVQAIAWVNRQVHRGYQDLSSQLSPGSDEQREGRVETGLMVDGWVIFVLRLTRFVCALALVVLAALEVVKGDANQAITAGLLASYTYVAILSLASTILTSTYWRRVTSRDASLCLFVGFVVYFLRDAWPYAILSPAQSHNANWLSWARFALLAFTGAFIPLIMPGSENDDLTRTADDPTRTLLVRVTFSYIDRTVYLAYRMADLKLADLPELLKSHQIAVLVKKGLPMFDHLIVGKRHMFFSMLRVFTFEYFMMAFWICISAFLNFLGPYGMKNLLTYLESREVSDSTIFFTTEGVLLQPWFWIAVVALAPTIGSIAMQQYLYFATLIEVKGESLLTRLVFENALRIRLRGETADKDKDTEKDGKKTKSDAEAPAPVPQITASVDNEALVETVMDPHAPSDSPTDSHLMEASAATTAVDTSDTASQAGSSKAASTKTPADGEGQKSKTVPIIGKINTLLTSDMEKVISAQEGLALPSCALNIGIAIFFLYSIVGWSAFVGLGVTIICIPAPGLVSSFLMTAQKHKMENTDQRVQSVTETLNILRTLKLLAWEKPTLKKLTTDREKEIVWLRYGKLLGVALYTLTNLLPLFQLLATFGTYTLIMKQPLSPATAFPALSIFSVLSEQIQQLMYYIPAILRAKVSYDRFTEYLNDSEMLVDTPLLVSEETAETTVQEDTRIGFNCASFTWKPITPQGGAETPSRRDQYQLRFDNEVLFKKGKLNLIVGPTASGKTSMLMALLDEMYYVPDGPHSWYSLPRSGGIAYASQESWVLNATVKENIVFNQPFDEDRYKKVLKQCALERDLDLWEAGDDTEVGEKGLTLSGGQKARVTLARALYSNAAIVLLDDPLAALDVHTARHIVDSALRGDLIRNRTVILVTHNIPLAGPLADFVVALNRGGRVVSQGTLSEALETSAEIRSLVKKEEAAVKEEEKAEDAQGKTDEESKKDRTAAGKLVVEEEKAIGRVEWAAIMLFVRGAGGLFTWTTILSMMCVAICAEVFTVWYIGYWASQYEGVDPADVSALKYLGMYAAIVLTGMASESLKDAFWSVRTMRASRVIYEKLLHSIMSAPFRWLDVVPVGRIVTRCTLDINAVDGPIGDLLDFFIRFTLHLTLLFFTIVVVSGLPALISGTILVFCGGYLGQLYLKTQLCIKREWTNAKSPVMTAVNTTISGIISVRAYGAQSYFREQLSQRIDTYARAGRTFYDLNRWIAFRADTLGGIFAGVVATYLVYGPGVGPSKVGFTMSIVLQFSASILFWVRIYNFLEVQCNSLERILGYLRIEQEPQPVDSGKPPAYWPSSGNLRVENLSASYSDDSPMVLKDLNFELKSGERVGVVGRTGAGKSSVALALLRAIKTTGKVYYDNIATDTINLDALRSHITLIPQQPELVRGTLRENLDPFGEHDDASLYDALRSAGLYNASSQSADDSSDSGKDVDVQINLDTGIESGGSNLSLGQRQIVSLARAIVRRSKLLILDEATAAIDYETDTVIQKSLRTELSRDTTVITIAHRLQTIMDYDKIMVLDAGRLVEFGSPAELLQKEEGFFRDLVQGSDDMTRLMEMAGVKSS